MQSHGTSREIPSIEDLLSSGLDAANAEYIRSDLPVSGTLERSFVTDTARRLRSTAVPTIIVYEGALNTHPAARHSLSNWPELQVLLGGPGPAADP